MKHSRKLTLATSMLVLLLSLSPAEGTAVTGYQEMVGHYEAIRLALLDDSLEGVQERAGALRLQAVDLRQSLTAELGAVLSHDVKAVSEALEMIETSSTRLTELTDIGAARDEFFVLTKPMVRYRKLTGDSDTLVAYCSMAQKAWIQPVGELGNPYMGEKMPKCGEVVGE